MAIPSENIEWTKIPEGASVELIGSVYVVDGKAVACWGGQEAQKAQATLDARATRKITCGRCSVPFLALRKESECTLCRGGTR